MAERCPVNRSAVSVSILKAGAKTTAEALPLEILHNLEYQHHWTDLQLHKTISSGIAPIIGVSPSSISTSLGGEYVISGLPPRHSYVHPDLLIHLIQHKLDETAINIQREWVLPMSTGETWNLRRFCHVFDHLPVRDPVEGMAGLKHQDNKRILCGMKAHDGSGGDGTIVYYIMQEGEVKPRQN